MALGCSLRFLGLAAALSLALPLAAAEDPTRALVDAFWFAETEAEAESAGESLLTTAGGVEALYRRLRIGPEFSAAVPVGVQRFERTASDGRTFPYVVLIPESYESARPYPVEFMLHGGVGRERPQPGDLLWRGGYDGLKREDRIVVVPAAWREAYWWQPAQAENVKAILRSLKQSYNVDDDRVSMTGVSDGGTGAYFFAFKQPTHWASYFAYIGHPGVLRNAQSGGGYQLYFENLFGAALYIVNGTNDRLYPAATMEPFIEVLDQAGIEHVFRSIEGGGHDTRWLPQERQQIEAFRVANVRDPHPETVQWVTDRTDRFNRNHWIRIDELSVEGRPSLLRATRAGNTIQVTARGVSEFTLMLSPEAVDFSNPLLVSVNGRVVLAGPVRQSSETLLDWAWRTHDRSQLYTAELTLEVPPG